MSEAHEYNDDLESKSPSKGLLIALGCVSLAAVVYVGHMYLGNSSFDAPTTHTQAVTPHKVYTPPPTAVTTTQPTLQAHNSTAKEATSDDAPKSEVSTTLSQYSQLTNELNLLNMQNQINTSKIALTKSNLELASLIPSPVIVKDNKKTKQSKKNANKTLSVGMIYTMNGDMHAKLNTPDGKINVVKGSSWGDGQYTVKDIDASSVTYTHNNEAKQLFINPSNAVEPS